MKKISLPIFGRDIAALFGFVFFFDLMGIGFWRNRIVFDHPSENEKDKEQKQEYSGGNQSSQGMIQITVNTKGEYIKHGKNQAYNGS